MAWRKSTAVAPVAVSSDAVMSDLPVVRWRDVVKQVVADVVVLPVDWIVTGMGAGVAPVTAEVVALIGGAGTAEREQVARDLDRHFAGKGLGLRHSQRSAGRFTRVARVPGDFVQRGRGPGKQRLRGLHAGG